MANVAKGSCLCGQLGFELTLPSKWVAHCHCSQCRRAHGAAFVTWVGVSDWNFRVSRGAEHLVWFRSSPDARRGHCNLCGSPMFFKSTKYPGETHVTLANLVDAVDKAPQTHVFHEEHVSWVTLADGLPRESGRGRR